MRQRGMTGWTSLARRAHVPQNGTGSYDIPSLPARRGITSMSTPNRRDFLRTATAGAALALAGRSPAAEGRRLRVAAVVTEFTYRSHAHCILENFLQPYYFDGHVTDSGCDVVSLYADQFPAGRDM